MEAIVKVDIAQLTAQLTECNCSEGSDEQLALLISSSKSNSVVDSIDTPQRPPSGQNQQFSQQSNSFQLQCIGHTTGLGDHH